MQANFMEDNSDVQQVHDGIVTDMRMEMLLEYFVARKWKEPELSELFSEVVREFIAPDAPMLRLDHLNEHDGGAMAFLHILGMSVTVTFFPSPQWPGAFDYMPDATVAVSVFYPGSDQATSFTAGKTFNQAALCAIVQYAREKSMILYNQGQLPLN